MQNLLKDIRLFLEEDNGVTSIEYALIASLIAIVIVTALGLVGTNLNSLWGRVANEVTKAVTPP